MDILDFLNKAASTQDTAALSQAKEKLRTEMDNNSNNAYVQAVGEHLLQQLTINPDMAEKVLNKDKTILKSLDAMKKVAETKKTGNFAMLTPQEGFDIIMRYFNE